MNDTISKGFKRGLLWRFLKGSRGLFLLSMLCAALSSLADMLSPQIIRVTVDHVLGGKADIVNPFLASLVEALGGLSYLAEHLWVLAAALLLTAFAKVLALYGFRVSNTKASERLTKTMRDTLCTSDIGTLKGFISEQMTSIFRIVILLVLSISFMAGMNPLLTLIACVPIPVILIYSLHFHRKIGEAFLQCDENEGKLSSMAQENLTGVRVVRAFGRERLERDRFYAQNEYYTGLWMKLARPMAQYWSTGDVLSGTQILLIVVFGSVFCLRGRMLAGEFIAFLSYAAMLTWPVRMLGRMIAEMSKAGVSIERIRYIMDSPVEQDPPDALTPEISGDITFDHVSFRVKAGTTLGILGGTGSGKSTMMLLLDKLYDLPADCGTISIGGVDIRDIDTRYLREHIGMVLQEPYLFSRSIAENIGITRETLDMEAVREAARAACLDETIQSFSKGYDTFVGERGVTLSGGQKQRAAIARMLTQQTPIMVFDDSLSAVDTETDARIRAALEARFGSASILLISHRITTLSKADQILVLENGRIVERGSHEELKDAGGIYQQICAIQSGTEEAVS